jgi:hypothetical protein
MTDLSSDVAKATPNATEADDGSGRAAIRTAHDAQDDKRLQRDPSDPDAKLDVALDESFPTSDAPSTTQPGKGKDPAPSSGYDAEAEARIVEEKAQHH